MPDLITFLRARLDEDERHALGVEAFGASCSWRLVKLAEEPPPGARWGDVVGERGTVIWGPERRRFDVDNAIAGHIAQWDPARVLAEVAAKRAILELAEHVWIMFGFDEGAADSVHDDTLRLMAQPYAEHPDFNQEW
jgi:hypothetical protein